jgi:hypothetical protein
VQPAVRPKIPPTLTLDHASDGQVAKDIRVRNNEAEVEQYQGSQNAQSQLVFGYGSRVNHVLPFGREREPRR